MIGFILSLALAFGDPLDGGFSHSEGGLLHRMDFSTLAPGCYTTPFVVSGLTFTRGQTNAVTRECWDGSTFQTCAANQVCFTIADDGSRGWRHEGPRSQLILNNQTHPKTGEITAAATSWQNGRACYIWARGSGTITATLNSGSATDPNGCLGRAISAGVPVRGEACRFDITAVGTTFAITTTAGVTAAQIECFSSAGNTQAIHGPTSLIATGGVLASRDPDALFTAPTAYQFDGRAPLSYCVRVIGVPFGPSVGTVFSTGSAASPYYGLFGFGFTSGGTLSQITGSQASEKFWTHPNALAVPVGWVPAGFVTPGVRNTFVAAHNYGSFSAYVSINGRQISNWSSIPSSPITITSGSVIRRNMTVGRSMRPAAAAYAFDGVITEAQYFWGACR